MHSKAGDILSVDRFRLTFSRECLHINSVMKYFPQNLSACGQLTVALSTLINAN